MATNRRYRRRTRRETLTDEMERFLYSGEAETGSDVVWHAFASPETIFQAWSEIATRRDARKFLAYHVFERGTEPCLRFMWLDQKAYVRWIAERGRQT